MPLGEQKLSGFLKFFSNCVTRCYRVLLLWMMLPLVQVGGGVWLFCTWFARWWCFLNIFYLYHWGKCSNLTNIFFKWLGSTTQLVQSLVEFGIDRTFWAWRQYHHPHQSARDLWFSWKSHRGGWSFLELCINDEVVKWWLQFYDRLP